MSLCAFDFLQAPELALVDEWLMSERLATTLNFKDPYDLTK